jgi:HEAT repeat protein
VLVSVIQKEPESTIRALAVSGLAFIDHESVFPAVLIGMADESREVRAAAARALSRSNFDRSEAYVYVLQTSDEETLGKVAQACIKAGLVSQNIDRLASGDRRQAYEAFALVSLLAKAKLIEPVLEAIQHHRDPRVRLSAVRLLAATGQTYVFEQLQQLAARDEIGEEVKTALLEGMYKLEQVRPKEEAPPDEFIIRERDEEFETDERMEDRSVFEFHERTEVDEVEL